MSASYEQDRLGKLVIFGFILGDNETTQIDSFNEILKEMGLTVKLEKRNGQFHWTCDATGDSVLAERIFDDIIHLFPDDKFKTCLEEGRFNFLFEEYERLINDEKRRIETLRWLSEFPDI